MILCGKKANKGQHLIIHYSPFTIDLLIFVSMNIEFNKNEDVMKQSLSLMRQKLEKIMEGGGKKAIAKQHEKNKLSPRERIDYLVDKDKPFIEIGAFAGYEMYDDIGGCPAGG